MQKTETRNDFPESWLAIKSNDEGALNALYLDNFKRVEDFVLKNNGNNAQAQDIFRESFIAVWRNIQLEKFIPENDHSLSVYLVKVAKNKWIDFLRSRDYQQFTSLETEVADEQTPADPHEEEYIKKVKIHFEGLGERCKEVLTRFYFYRESMEKIGQIFNWTKATARNNKYRCLEQLRNLINKTP